MENHLETTWRYNEAGEKVEVEVPHFNDRVHGGSEMVYIEPKSGGEPAIEKELVPTKLTYASLNAMHEIAESWWGENGLDLRGCEEGLAILAKLADVGPRCVGTLWSEVDRGHEEVKPYGDPNNKAFGTDRKAKGFILYLTPDELFHLRHLLSTVIDLHDTLAYDYAAYENWGSLGERKANIMGWRGRARGLALTMKKLDRLAERLECTDWCLKCFDENLKSYRRKRGLR